MRIAVFHNLTSGGAKRALFGAVRHLSGAGHRLTLFTVGDADDSYLPLAPFLEGTVNEPVRRTVVGWLRSSVSELRPSPSPLPDLERAHREVARRIDDGGFDVVLAEQDRFTMAPFLLRHVGTPAAYSCPQAWRYTEEVLQRVLDDQQAGTPLARLRAVRRRLIARERAGVDRRNALGASYIFANSYFTRESLLRAYGVNAYVSYPGVDADTFRPVEAAEEDFVLTVGACNPAKGQDFLIRSLGLLPGSERPALRLVANMVEPAWRAHLERLAEEAGVRLEILQLIADRDLVELYASARLVLYAPHLEPLGLVPLEAMACARAVVAVREGGVRETVVHDETGVLTERDPGAFADATAALLRDAPRRREMGRRGAERVREFWTFEHAGRRLEAHLERATRAAP